MDLSIIKLLLSIFLNYFQIGLLMKKFLFILVLFFGGLFYSIYNFGFNYSYLKLVGLFTSTEQYSVKVKKFITDDKMYERTSFISFITEKDYETIKYITKKKKLENEIIDELIKLNNTDIIKDLLTNKDLINKTITRLIAIGNKEQKILVSKYENIPEEAILIMLNQKEFFLIKKLLNNKVVFPTFLKAYKKYLSNSRNMDFINNKYIDFNLFKTITLGDYEDVLFFTVANEKTGLFELIYIQNNKIIINDKNIFRYGIEPKYAKGIEYFSPGFQKARKKAETFGIKTNKKVLKRLNKIGEDIKKHTIAETSYETGQLSIPTLLSIGLAAGKTYLNREKAIKEAPRNRETVLKYLIKAEAYQTLKRKFQKASTKEVLLLWKQLLNANDDAMYGSFVIQLSKMKKINNTILNEIVKSKVKPMYKMMADLKNIPRKYKKIFANYENIKSEN